MNTTPDIQLPDDVVLDIQNLKTYFPLRAMTIKAVDDVSLTLRRGKTTCVVGESGSGKSITARSILQIVDSPGQIEGGSYLCEPHRALVALKAL